jgi:hypothetical protein
MRTDKPIYKKEFAVLLMVSAVLLISVLMRFSWEVVTGYNESVRSQQTVLEWRADGKGSIAIDYEPKIVPLYHLLSVFLFLGIIKARRFIFALLITIFYIFSHLFALSQRYSHGGFLGDEILPPASFPESLYKYTDTLDIFVAITLLIVLIWLALIVIRGLSRERKMISLR